MIDSYATTDLVSVERSLAARNGAFLPLNVYIFLRHHGACPRGAMIDSYSGLYARGAMIGSYATTDLVSVERSLAARNGAFLPLNVSIFYATTGLVPWGDDWQLRDAVFSGLQGRLSKPSPQGWVNGADKKSPRP
jgi:hypothetical protein